MRVPYGVHKTRSTNGLTAALIQLRLNKIKRQVYRIWQMGFIVLGYLGFFFVVWLQINYAVKDQPANSVDKFYAVVFSLLNMVMVIVCVFIFVSYRYERIDLRIQQTSVVWLVHSVCVRLVSF
jgi:hypothetical protein